MVGPQIPYIEVPELPLRFLTHLPDSALGAILGFVVGVVVASAIAGETRNKALALAGVIGAALLGAFVGYSHPPHLDPLHPPSIKPFGALVALGVAIGSKVAMNHARERGINEKKMSEFIFWVVASGFVGGHVLDAIFYHPDRLAREPVYLLELWEGLSSYGGFTGAVIGAVAWKMSRREPILGMCEVINSAFPLAWVFGRAGCASVHDHKGMVSGAWFALQRWKDEPLPPGLGRLDLGLIEMVLTIPLAVTFLVLWRRKPERPLGFYTGIMCVAYAPVRFFLDFLREEERFTHDDPRYGGLTPAQWACFGLLALGIYFLRVAFKAPPKGSPEKPGEDAPPAEADGGPAAPA